MDLDVFYPLPEGWGLCLTCEAMLARAGLSSGFGETGLDEYPREYREEVQRLTDWVYTLAGRYGADLTVRIHDPRSPRGMWKALRAGARRYPAFVVPGYGRVLGWKREQLDDLLARASSPGRFAARRQAAGARRAGAWALERLRRGIFILAQMAYGMTVYEMVRDLQKERGKLERMFVLIVFGDLFGLPILPPYYTLRLLPFIVPNLNAWRHSLHRERDLTDLCDTEIG